MTYITTFKVSGNGMFPFDMLRYDGCYPLDPDAVARMCVTPDERDVYFKERFIRLAKVHAGPKHNLTFDRWSSFLWGVHRDSIDTRKLSA